MKTVLSFLPIHWAPYCSFIPRAIGDTLWHRLFRHLLCVLLVVCLFAWPTGWITRSCLAAECLWLSWQVKLINIHRRALLHANREKRTSQRIVQLSMRGFYLSGRFVVVVIGCLSLLSSWGVCLWVCLMVYQEIIPPPTKCYNYTSNNHKVAP